MDNLYNDIYIHIFSFLEHKDLINLMMVSKKFYTLIDNLKLPNVDFYTSCLKGYYLNIKKEKIENYNVNKALYFASKGGHKPIINLLIKSGAKYWELGLQGACEGGHKSIAEFMISNGAKNYNWGLTGACKGGHRDLVEFMIYNGANNWNWGLEGAYQGGHKDIIDFMIYNGAKYWNLKGRFQVFTEI